MVCSAGFIHCSGLVCSDWIGLDFIVVLTGLGLGSIMVDWLLILCLLNVSVFL